MIIDQNILEKLSNNEFVNVKVTYNDGTVEKRCLFMSSTGMVCVFNKGSRKRGVLVDHYYNQWRSIVAIDKTVKSDVVVVRKFLTKTILMLTKSGLWANIKNDFTVLNNLSNDELSEYIHADYHGRELLNSKYGIGYTVDDLLTTARKGVVSITYNKYERDIVKANFAEAIKNKKEYNHYWEYNYDCRVSCKQAGNTMMAWYSQEYKGCGNGHYYLAIDESHAIFAEND